jgi:actin-related protein
VSVAGVPWPNVLNQCHAGPSQGVYVGNEAQRTRGLLDLRFPVEPGFVTNWDDMEVLWQHAFRDQLRLESEVPGASIS